MQTMTFEGQHLSCPISELHRNLQLNLKKTQSSVGITTPHPTIIGNIAIETVEHLTIDSVLTNTQGTFIKGATKDSQLSINLKDFMFCTLTEHTFC